ncbi:hypothetical protein [Novosphingobium album (ex Liu et al. 2023)]|uniref:Uncharacterized protein n=1 Tax=Novosphingobium album (ex Liu et al. 2023) TaxID=3031130 RepID=A0ABT5WWF0_9SPHN|nr:hypothetical protein [Novosphingobium album (ex Liu et al. 2023)]MDE8654222.1 hypothetical protein [Novosphingobium album (ex Liu et al. 2023)]
MSDITHRQTRGSERSAFDGAQEEDVLHAFLFRLAESRQYGLSSDAKGRSLPRGSPEVSAWVFIRPIDLVAGESRVEFDSEEAARSLRRDGYALVGCMVAR